MSGFINTDLSAFRGVWVICEQNDGVVNPTSFELLSEGRKLADDLGVELCGVLLGGDVAALAGQPNNARFSFAILRRAGFVFGAKRER